MNLIAEFARMNKMTRGERINLIALMAAHGIKAYRSPSGRWMAEHRDGVHIALVQRPEKT